MTPGASFSSAASTATWTLVTGAGDANYPVANLSDLVNISKVCRVTPAANVAVLTFNLSAAAAVQFLGLVRHGFTGAETVRMRLYAGAGQTGAVLLDTGVISVWPSGAPVSGYSPSRPYVLTAEVTALSGRLDFAGLSSFEIGGIEVARWLPLTISPGVQFGFDTRAADVALVGGGAQAGDMGFLPRVVNGQVDFMALATAAVTALDFQKLTGKGVPFVFVQDADDPTSWSRWCFLARNQELPPLVGATYRHDRFQLRLRESYR